MHLKDIYRKLFKIDDSPQKIALGFGLGVFLGILPGTGPLASLFCAVLLRLNRVSALLGSLLVNTWINVVTFLLAIKIGSVIMGLNWQQVYKQSKLSIPKVIAPLLIGYLVIAVCLSILAYLIVLIMFALIKRQPQKIKQ